MWHDSEVNFFLYLIEYEVKLGVYVCVCTCVCVHIWTWVGLPEWSKKKGEKVFLSLKMSDHYVKGYGHH